MLPQHQIVSIKYFSALIQNNADARLRQQAYWSALASLPLTKIIPGNFKKKSATCWKASCTYPGSRTFSTVEEKRTDVNIALEMLDDAYQRAAEQFVVVTGDSDIAPALSLVKKRFPAIRIALYVPAAKNPHRGKAPELRALADRPRNFAVNLCAANQLPNPVIMADGTAIHKPATW